MRAHQLQHEQVGVGVLHCHAQLQHFGALLHGTIQGGLTGRGCEPYYHGIVTLPGGRSEDGVRI